MRQDSIALEAELEMWTPQNIQVYTRCDQHGVGHLQTLHMHTLLYTQVITGAGDRWKNAVKDICGDVESLGELLHNLELVERTVAPNTNAKFDSNVSDHAQSSIHEASHFAASRCKSLSDLTIFNSRDPI